MSTGPGEVNIYSFTFIPMTKVYKQCQSCGMPLKMDKK